MPPANVDLASSVSFGLMHAAFDATSARHTACGCWPSKA
jgi:hypothetical protein